MIFPDAMAAASVEVYDGLIGSIKKASRLEQEALGAIETLGGWLLLSPEPDEDADESPIV